MKNSYFPVDGDDSADLVNCVVVSVWGATKQLELSITLKLFLKHIMNIMIIIIIR